MAQPASEWRESLRKLRPALSPVWILIALGFLTRFLFIAHPPNIVWDEQFFAEFSSTYLTGNFHFDIHPPLGKLLLAAGLKIGGGLAFGEEIVQRQYWPEGYPYVAARCVHAFCCAFLPAIVYGIGRRLGFSTLAAAFAGSLVLLETAVLAQHRLMVIDGFVHVFGAAGILFLLYHRETPRRTFDARVWLALAGIFLGASASVKWTGLGYLVTGLAACVEVPLRREWLTVAARTLAILGSAAVVYLGSFAVHFTLLDKCGSGSGMMSKDFNASFLGGPVGEPGVRPLGFFGKVAEHHRVMWRVNTGRIRHSMGSTPWQWIWGRRTVYLWRHTDWKPVTIIQGVNPIAWLAGAAGLVACGALLVRRWNLPELAGPEGRRGAAILLVHVIANWLPFWLIRREMFLYHHIGAWIGSALLAAWLFGDLLPRALAWKEERTRRMVGIWIALAAAVFLVWSPVMYALEVPWEPAVRWWMLRVWD